MPFAAHKVLLGGVSDASGLESLISGGQINPDHVIAVVGKTEGNGGVNDYTRILADQAFRTTLAVAQFPKSNKFQWLGLGGPMACCAPMLSFLHKMT